MSKKFINLIIGLIIISLIASGVFISISLNQDNDGNDRIVLKVNGEGIKNQVLIRAIESERNLMARQLQMQPQNIPNNKVIIDKAINNIVNVIVLKQKLQGLDVFVANKAIDQFIGNIDVFKKDGKFNEQLYLETISKYQYTPKDFREEVKLNLKNKLISDVYSNSNFLYKDGIKFFYILNNQTRDFTYAILDYNNVDYKFNENELKEFFENNKENYKILEKLKFKYTVLDKNSIKLEKEITEEDLKQEYNNYLNTVSNKEIRASSHILILINDDRSEEEAKKITLEIKEKLDKGESFQDLAKQYSEDPGTKEQGGYLGESEKGNYVANFEDTLFNKLNRVGEISDPVLTEYGYHIIKLNDIKNSKAKSYEEKKESLKEDLLKLTIDKEYLRLESNILEGIDDNKITNIDSVQKEYNNLKILESDFINISELTSGFKDSNIDFNSVNSQSFYTALVSLIFMNQDYEYKSLPKNILKYLKLDENKVLFVEVIDKQKDYIPELDKVKDKVIADYESNKKNKLLREKTYNIANSLYENNLSLDFIKEVSNNENLDFIKVEDFGKGKEKVYSITSNKELEDKNKVIDQSVASLAFATPSLIDNKKNVNISMIAENKSLIVILDKINLGEDGLEEIINLENKLDNNNIDLKNISYDNLQKLLKKKEINISYLGALNAIQFSDFLSDLVKKAKIDKLIEEDNN